MPGDEMGQVGVSGVGEWRREVPWSYNGLRVTILDYVPYRS